MKIETTSILVDDAGNEIKDGTVLSFVSGKRSLIGKFSGIKSAGLLTFENPITGESYNIRLSSISKAKRCSFKMTEE